MKSYHDNHGNLIHGTSILEDILGSARKTASLLKVLDRFKMRIVPEAELRDTKRDWIVPVSWEEEARV